MTPFRDDYIDPKATADARTVAPDWAAIEAALGEVAEVAETDAAKDLASQAIHRLLGWLVRGKRLPSTRLDELIGRRTLALIWVVRPDLIEGTPSLASLAARCGTTRAALSVHTRRFTEAFGITNRAQPTPAGRSKPMRAARRIK